MYFIFQHYKRTIRAFVHSYRELEIRKVTPKHKRRKFLRVELLITSNTTFVLDTPKETEPENAETKSGRRSSQFSDQHLCSHTPI